jgi:hypothetical protein
MTLALHDDTTPARGFAGSTPRRPALPLGDRRTQIVDTPGALGFGRHTVTTDAYAKVLSPSSGVREHWHIRCFIPSLAPRRL